MERFSVEGCTGPERVIDPALDQVFRTARGRIIVATFASLISRVQQVADATARHGRKMALAGSSMIDNVKIARKLGYLNIPGSVPVHASWLYANNLLNYVQNLFRKGLDQPDLDDEIVRHTLVTHQGQILHAGALKSMKMKQAAVV